MEENEVKVSRNYSFWRHPIKWWNDRKNIALLNMYVNYQWEHGMREEVAEMKWDIFKYGTAIMDKNGKRVNPEKFAP